MPFSSLSNRVSLFCRLFGFLFPWKRKQRLSLWLRTMRGSSFYRPFISSTNGRGFAVSSTHAGRNPLRIALRTEGRFDHAAQ